MRFRIRIKVTYFLTCVLIALCCYEYVTCCSNMNFNRTPFSRCRKTYVHGVLPRDIEIRIRNLAFFFVCVYACAECVLNRDAMALRTNCGPDHGSAGK